MTRSGMPSVLCSGPHGAAPSGVPIRPGVSVERLFPAIGAQSGVGSLKPQWVDRATHLEHACMTHLEPFATGVSRETKTFGAMRSTSVTTMNGPPSRRSGVVGNGERQRSRSRSVTVALPIPCTSHSTVRTASHRRRPTQDLCPCGTHSQGARETPPGSRIDLKDALFTSHRCPRRELA